MPPGPWVHQDFARTLYPTFKGRALWQASPPVRGWTCNDGLRVGDVYVLFGDNGMFWFNVSLPKDHERNLRAPKDHQPIHLEPDVDVITTRHSRHSLLGATNSANDPLKMSARGADANHYTITTAASEGGFFVLPFGGSSYECTESGKQRIAEYLQRNALSIAYNYRASGRDLWNGEICVITGCDMASYWASAYFRSHTKQSIFSVNVNMPPDDSDASFNTPMISRSDMSGFAGRLQSHQTPGEIYRVGGERSCLSIRAFYTSIDPYLFNTEFCYPSPTRCSPTRLVSLLPPSFRPPIRSITRDIEWVFVPSREINELMHHSARHASACIVHDDDFISVLKKDEVILPRARTLLRRVTRTHAIAVSSEGVAYLVPRDRPNSRWGKVVARSRDILGVCGRLRFESRKLSSFHEESTVPAADNKD